MSVPKSDLDLLAIGETVVDFISVEKAESLQDATTFRKYQGGSPANIALYVAKLGGRAAVVSRTGAGAFGRFLRAELERAGVLTDYLVEDPSANTSVIFVSHTTGTPDFEAFRDADYRLSPEDVPEEAVERARALHASTFALSREPCRTAVEKAFRLARARGKIVSLDPNYSPRVWPDTREAMKVLSRLFGYATITKPSLDDATRLFGPGETPEAYIERFHAMGPRIVVLTMGARGVLLSEQGRLAHVPARPIKVEDATAAGDAFWAGFLVAMLDGNPCERCVLFAREIVERKLSTIGPPAGIIDRQAIYARLEARED